MAQNYVVNYDINVFAEDAVQAIGRFTMASEQLKKASAPFQKLNQKINSLKANISSLGKVKAEVFINTKQAEAKIDRLQGKLERLMATARSLNMTVGAGGGSVAGATSRGRAASRTTTVATGGGNGRRVSSTLNRQPMKDPVVQRWERLQSSYAARAKLIRDNAAMFGWNYKTDPLYQRYMEQSRKAGTRAFARQNPGVMNAWTAARENFVEPTPVPRGRARGGTRVAPVRARYRSLYPNALGYKMLGATPMDVGGIGAVDILKGMGIAYGIAGLGTGIGSAISNATEYDNIMQTTKNILGSHDNRDNFEGRFHAMERNVRQIGVKTKFTAPEVADASRFLAMAGLNIEEINSAIRPITDIALIADTDLGETADVVTNIMTAYGMGANQMRDIADKMTMTFTMSNTTLPEMAESYKYFASIARANNWSFDETTGMIGILGDAGLKGSHAGTTIRQLMNNLLKPSKSQKAALDRFGVTARNADGTLRSPYAIFKDLAEAGAQSSTFDLFRVTAAQGGVSLMQSVEKWDKIIEENRKSAGISTRLAEAKQNTVQGLWAQTTSMFTEGAMQAFEAVRPQIADMLKSVTEWLGTDDARSRIKAFAEDILNFARILGDFTKTIMDFYEKFRKPIMLFLELQLRMWPVIYGLRVLKSAWYAVLGAIRLTQGFGAFINGFVTLAANIRRSTAAMMAFRRANASMGWGGAFNYGAATMAHGKEITPAVWERYQRMYGGRGGAIGGMGRGMGLAPGVWSSLRTGIGGVVGGGLGYAIGNAIDEDNGGMWGAIAGGLAGSALMVPGAWSAITSLAPMLFTNPVGWGILAVGAVASLGAAFYTARTEISKGHEEAQLWLDDFHQLSIAGIDLGKQFGLIQAYQRIEASGLSNAQKDILRQQAFERWNDLNNSSVEMPDEATPYANLKIGEQLKHDLEIADQTWGKWAYFGDILKGLPGFHQNKKWLQGDEYSDAEFDGHILWYNNPAGGMTSMDETQATQAALLLAGMDANSPIAQKIQELAMSQIFGVSRASDIANVWQRLRDEYMPKHAYSYSDKSSEDVMGMSYNEIAQSQYYQYGLNWRLRQLQDEYSDWERLITNYDNDVAIQAEQIQRVLYARLGQILNPTYGLFGTEEFNKKIQEIINDPTKYGYNSQKSAITAVQKTFTDLLDFFNLLDVRYKPLFAEYLNRNIWEGLLPQGYTLPAGGYIGGKTTGQKAMFDGVEYEWKELGPPYASGTYGWVDKDGKRYVPSNASHTQGTLVGGNNNPGGTTTPTNNTGLTGANQSNYKSHYNNNSAAPKQVIVKIENLMNVKSIDLTNPDNVAVINDVKQQLTQALIDVVHDFDETYHG